MHADDELFAPYAFPRSIRAIAQTLLEARPTYAATSPRGAPATVAFDEQGLSVTPVGADWSLRFDRAFDAWGSRGQAVLSTHLALRGPGARDRFLAFGGEQLGVVRQLALEPSPQPLLVELVLCPAQGHTSRGVSGNVQVLTLEAPAVSLGLHFFAAADGTGWVELVGPRGKKSREQLLHFAAGVIPEQGA
jgi:hypothetical protein